MRAGLAEASAGALMIGCIFHGRSLAHVYMKGSHIDRDLAKPLLVWYDRHARDLPWRISPKDRKSGQRPDPYHVWLSEIMLQQTTVATVKSYFDKFTLRWPSMSDFAAASEADVMAQWAGLGYYSRARNLLKTAKILAEDYGSQFPDDPNLLIKFPGIGPYTSAAIASIAFDRRATIVDGNVERVIARMVKLETPLPKAKSEIFALADKITPEKRPGDYAQAIMDLGATICTPRKPNCSNCPWSQHCAAHQDGTQEAYPKKQPKAPKPTRIGTVYIVERNDGAILVERRPPKGLLGGMLAFPATEFSQEQPKENPPIKADWVTLNNPVKHVFTHFHLNLTVKIATDIRMGSENRGEFLAADDFNVTSLPNLMQKAWQMAAPHFRINL